MQPKFDNFLFSLVENIMLKADMCIKNHTICKKCKLTKYIQLNLCIINSDLVQCGVGE